MISACEVLHRQRRVAIQNINRDSAQADAEVKAEDITYHVVLGFLLRLYAW